MSTLDFTEAGRQFGSSKSSSTSVALGNLSPAAAEYLVSPQALVAAGGGDPDAVFSDTCVMPLGYSANRYGMAGEISIVISCSRSADAHKSPRWLGVPPPLDGTVRAPFSRVRLNHPKADIYPMPTTREAFKPWRLARLRPEVTLAHASDDGVTWKQAVGTALTRSVQNAFAPTVGRKDRTSTGSMVDAIGRSYGAAGLLGALPRANAFSPSRAGPVAEWMHSSLVDAIEGALGKLPRASSGSSSTWKHCYPYYDDFQYLPDVIDWPNDGFVSAKQAIIPVGFASWTELSDVGELLGWAQNCVKGSDAIVSRYTGSQNGYSDVALHPLTSYIAMESDDTFRQVLEQFVAARSAIPTDSVPGAARFIGTPLTGDGLPDLAKWQGNTVHTRVWLQYLHTDYELEGVGDATSAYWDVIP